MAQNFKLIAKHQVTLPGCEISPDWMIGCRTRRVDSWSPSLEQILLPRMLIEPKPVEIGLAEGVSDLFRDRWDSVWDRLPIPRRRRPVRAEGILFDTRFDTSNNYAHVLVNQLGKILLAKSEGVISDLSELRVVVPDNAPAYALEVWEIAGTQVLRTNSPVEGRHLVVSDLGNAGMMMRGEWSRFFAS